MLLEPQYRKFSLNLIMQTIWLSQNKVRGKFFFNVQTSKSSKKLLGKRNIWANQRKIYLVQKKKFAQNFPFLIMKNICYLPRVKREAHDIY